MLFYAVHKKLLVSGKLTVHTKCVGRRLNLHTFSCPQKAQMGHESSRTRNFGLADYAYQHFFLTVCFTLCRGRADNEAVLRLHWQRNKGKPASQALHFNLDTQAFALKSKLKAFQQLCPCKGRIIQPFITNYTPFTGAMSEKRRSLPLPYNLSSPRDLLPAVFLPYSNYFLDYSDCLSSNAAFSAAAIISSRSPSF